MSQNKRDFILTFEQKVIKEKNYYKWQKHSFRSLNKGIRNFQGEPHHKAMIIAQKAVSLQLAKFHAILTPRPMISTSAFLSCAMISGVHESPERPWRSFLHQA